MIQSLLSPLGELFASWNVRLNNVIQRHVPLPTLSPSDYDTIYVKFQGSDLTHIVLGPRGSMHPVWTGKRRQECPAWKDSSYIDCDQGLSCQYSHRYHTKDYGMGKWWP